MASGRSGIQSHPYKKIKSDTAEFEVPVGANSKVVLSYTVRREV